MEIPRNAIENLGIGEYQLMKEELDRECILMVFGFGKTIDGNTEIPLIILSTPLEDKQKYVGAETDCGWGVMQNGSSIEAIYLNITFKGIKTIRVSFNKNNTTVHLNRWFKTLIDSNGLLVLNDCNGTGALQGIGIKAVPLDVPKIMLSEFLLIPEQETMAALKFAMTLTFTNGVCPICKEQVYKMNEDNLSMSVDIEAGAAHFKNHTPEEKRKYEYWCEFLGL